MLPNLKEQSLWTVLTRAVSRHIIAATLAVLAIAGAAAVSFFAVTRVTHSAVGQGLAIGGQFTLSKPDGTLVTDRYFRGKWLIVYFGYTFCPDACPAALTDITTALAQLGPLADKIQPIFITVDPERDTPQVLADYISSFDPRFVALRGTTEQTAAVAARYRVYYAARDFGGGYYAVDHSSFIYLVGPDGNVVKVLTGDPPGHPLAEELRQLIQQSAAIPDSHAIR